MLILLVAIKFAEETSHQHAEIFIHVFPEPDVVKEAGTPQQT
jgi:hypothetical protein